VATLRENVNCFKGRRPTDQLENLLGVRISAIFFLLEAMHAVVVKNTLRRWLNLRKPTITLYAKTNGDWNSVTMTDMKPNVNTTSQMDGESNADSSNLLIAVRPDVSRRSQPTGHVSARSQPTGHVSATCISSDQCQSYDSNLRQKLHHNSNPFIIRRYDSRIKKCRGCGNEMWM